MQGPIALLDANVLYPATLRDLLMRLALRGLFRARWTAAIHAEWMRNVLADRPDLRPEQIERTRALMDAHVPGCLVTGYERLIDHLELPDLSDRHVLAAAVRSRAEFIITWNLRDFPALRLAPLKLSARDPDAFILGLLATHPAGVIETARSHRALLRNPPRDVDEYLDGLARVGIVRTADRLREYAAAL